MLTYLATVAAAGISMTVLALVLRERAYARRRRRLRARPIRTVAEWSALARSQTSADPKIGWLVVSTLAQHLRCHPSQLGCRDILASDFDLQLPNWIGVELDGELSAGFEELGMLIQDDAALQDKLFAEWRQFQALSDVMVAMEGNMRDHRARCSKLFGDVLRQTTDDRQ